MIIDNALTAFFEAYDPFFLAGLLGLFIASIIILSLIDFILE